MLIFSESSLKINKPKDDIRVQNTISLNPIQYISDLIFNVPEKITKKIASPIIKPVEKTKALNPNYYGMAVEEEAKPLEGAKKAKSSFSTTRKKWNTIDPNVSLFTGFLAKEEEAVPLARGSKNISTSYTRSFKETPKFYASYNEKPTLLDTISPMSYQMRRARHFDQSRETILKPLPEQSPIPLSLIPPLSKKANAPNVLPSNVEYYRFKAQKKKSRDDFETSGRFKKSALSNFSNDMEISVPYIQTEKKQTRKTIVKPKAKRERSQSLLETTGSTLSDTIPLSRTDLSLLNSINENLALQERKFWNHTFRPRLTLDPADALDKKEKLLKKLYARALGMNGDFDSHYADFFNSHQEAGQFMINPIGYIAAHPFMVGLNAEGLRTLLQTPLPLGMADYGVDAVFIDNPKMDAMDWVASDWRDRVIFKYQDEPLLTQTLSMTTVKRHDTQAQTIIQEIEDKPAKAFFKYTDMFNSIEDRIKYLLDLRQYRLFDQKLLSFFVDDQGVKRSYHDALY